MNEADFLAIFQNQLAGELKRATDLALELEKSPGEHEILQSLMREFHTIKGAARAIQFEEIKDCAHYLEEVYHQILENKCEQRPQLIDLTFFTVDLIQDILAKTLAQQPLPDYQQLQVLVEEYLSGENPTVPNYKQHNDEEATQANSSNNAPKENSAEIKKAAQDGIIDHHEESTEDDSATVGDTEEMIQSRANNKYQSDEQLMDNLFNLSGEIVIAVGAFNPQRNALRKAMQGVSHLQRLLEKQGQQELLAQIQQVTNDQNEALEILDGVDNRMRFLSEELDDRVSTARLVALDRVFSSYPRVVRDLAKELGKSCQLELVGEQTRIDRGVLEAVRAPLMHLIRNALDHGLESPAERKRLEKPALSNVSIKAVQLGSQIEIRISDDGRGIDMEKVKQKVLSRGDTSEVLWDAMDLFERHQFLFLPGFTMAEQVTDISGRGVGLDVVKSSVEKVGGRVSLNSQTGQGCQFVLELPLTLSMTRCLLIQGGKHPFFGIQHYAFPEHDLERVQRITSADIRIHEGKETVRINKESIPLYSFCSVMGLSPLKENLSDKYVLILGDSNKIALLVENVVEEQAIVRRRFDHRLGKLRNIDGVSLLRNGSMALIVDMLDLFNTLSDPDLHINSVQNETYQSVAEVKSKKILVVEDSQTVREVEKHFLQSAGFEVGTAVDGVDGFDKVRSNQYDLVISDIDMPRMNGIELIEKIRQQEKLKHLPIIVVSYKDRDQDRQKALHAGANFYVVKSEFDTDTMIQNINSLLVEYENMNQ